MYFFEPPAGHPEDWAQKNTYERKVIHSVSLIVLKDTSILLSDMSCSSQFIEELLQHRSSSFHNQMFSSTNKRAESPVGPLFF